ncbi:MAG: hypothetical protein DRN30_04230 [Thermoplasmata archaeon]|nr:MAG: hypothetical protein DRN30_04230 [Thermoplasmata archaeon]
MADKAGSNTFETLNGHFKETYADRIEDLRPDGVKLLNAIEFMPSAKMQGNLYHQPIILSHEQGFTYGGSAGTAFSLSDAVQSGNQDAQVRGSELVLRSILSVAAASRSTNSAASFIQETKLLVENMLKSTAKRVEIEILYGQENVGVVDSLPTTTSFVVKDHHWASGIWSGMEGAVLSIFDAAYGVKRADVNVVSVDLTTKTITVDVDISAAGVVDTDVIHFLTAAAVGPIFNEFIGIHAIITNTGTLFNVNASSYNLWKGNITDVGTDATSGASVLTFESIEVSVAKAMDKGLNDEDITVLVSPLSWKNLLVEQDAKRMYDSSYSKEMADAGSKSIKFYGQNGIIEIVSSIYCKEGFAYALPLKEYMRVGSTDITFEQPGMEGKFFRLLENHNGYEMRCYTDQALFTSKPGLSTLLRFIKS